jgi:hypothetical protein
VFAVSLLSAGFPALTVWADTVDGWLDRLPATAGTLTALEANRLIPIELTDELSNRIMFLMELSICLHGSTNNSGRLVVLAQLVLLHCYDESFNS